MPRNRQVPDLPDLTAPTGATPEELRRLNRVLSTRAVQLVDDLRAANATREAAERQRGQISRTLLQQTHDLRELERLYAAQKEEVERLRKEVADLRAAGGPDGGAQDRQIATLQDQLAQQTLEIRDLGRRIGRLTETRDRLQDTNDHLAREVELAGDEIHQLQEQQRFTDRELEDAYEAQGIAEAVLFRAQEARRDAEAALQERDRSTQAGSAPDQLVQERDQLLRERDHLVQERNRAETALADTDHRLSRTRDELDGLRAIYRQTQQDLNTARATQAAATTDLVSAVEERDAAVLDADRARSELEDLSTFLLLGLKFLSRELTSVCRAGTSLDTAERTVGLLEGQIRQIREQHSHLQRDHAALQRNRNALHLEHDVALQRLAIVVTAVGARPLPAEEVGDPAALLRMLHELPQPPTDRQQTAEDTEHQDPEPAPPEGPKLPDTEPGAIPVTVETARSGSSKRIRSRSASVEADPARPVKRPAGSASIETKDHDIEMEEASVSPDHDYRKSPAKHPLDHPRSLSQQPDPSRLQGQHPDPEDRDEGGQIADDGGDNSDHEGGEDEEETERSGADGAGRTSSTGGSNGEEDAETAEIADELLNAQILQAMAQSRSTERRRQHASPKRGSAAGGSGGPPDDNSDDDDGGDARPGSDPRGRGPDPASRGPPTPNPLAPVTPFGPEDQCIPGRTQPRILVQVDVEPWIIAELNTVSMMSMLIHKLFPALPIRLGWIFPYHEQAEDCPQVSDSDFCAALITEANVRALLATRPWEVLENSEDPITFEADVGGRLGLVIQKYQAYEKANWQTYWEATHHFPISPAAMKLYPWLAVYQKERKNRRSHAGSRWKGILMILIVAMREGWCDLDLLLDTFFLHFPRRQESVIWYPGYESRQANVANTRLSRPEPTDLLEALDECNDADPWRNHYRDSPQDHPARQIPRLTDKFFGVHVAGAE